MSWMRRSRRSLALVDLHLPFTVSRVDALSAIVRIDEHALIVVQGETARTHARRLDHPALDPVP
jgi:hypothetical protein